MSVVGTALNAPESAVVLARENPLDLQGRATSPPAQQPELLDRVPLAICHQEIPEPGFPHRCTPVPFDRSFTTNHLEDNYLFAIPACGSPHADRHELHGHTDVSTTMIYAHIPNRGPPAMGQAKYIQPVPAHPQNPGEGSRLQP